MPVTDNKTSLVGRLLITAALSVSAMFASCDRSPQSKLDIIGGHAVQADDPIAQSAAALINNDGSVQCTVAPIRENVFVTAAHCVYGRNLEEWTIHTGLKAGDGETLAIQSTIIHSQFASGLLYSSHPDVAPNDIALIQTTAPSAGVIPVPIIRGIVRQSLIEPFEVVIAGYGRTLGQSRQSNGVLQKTRLTITQTDSDRHEFSSDDAHGKMGCHGDSGGPAFYQDGRTLVLIGIVSRGDNACTKGKTIFTDVADFSSFISDGITRLNISQQSIAGDHQ